MNPLIVAAALSVAVQSSVAAAQSELPSPLRSRDLQKWIADLKPSDAQRVAIEKAFDEQTEHWMQLRDQTIRPAQTKYQAAMGDPSAIAGWNNTLGRATASLGSIERTMFDSMHVSGLTDEQSSQLDRLAATRARKRAGAVVHGLPMNLPRVPGLKDLPEETRTAIEVKTFAWEASATPVIERLAVATLDDNAAERTRDLRRKILSGERAAVRDIASLLPAESAKNYLGSFRRQTLPQSFMWSGSPTGTPDSIRKQLNGEQNKEALAMLEAWQKQREELEEAAMDALLAEVESKEAIGALESKYSQLNRDSLADIAKSANMPQLNEPQDGMFFSMGGPDGAEIDLADFGDLGDLGELGGEGGVAVFAMNGDVAMEGDAAGGVTAMRSVVVMRADGNGESLQPGEAKEIRVLASRAGQPLETAHDMDPSHAAIAAKTATAMGSAIGEALRGNMVFESADAGAGHPSPMMLGGRIKPLSRQDLEQLRLRLKVPESQLTLWETLCKDLLQANAEWMSKAPDGPMANMMPRPGQSPADFVAERAARAGNLANIEETWFDNVRAGVQGVEAASVDIERSRRALQRALAATRAGGMMMPTLLMSRWGRVDLDAAMETLSPSGAARAAAALQVWRTSMLVELAAAQVHMDEVSKAQLGLMQSIQQEEKDSTASTSLTMNMDGKRAAELERAREPLQNAWKRVEAAQAAGVESVADSLPPADANALRRAVRQQTHPEVFRSQNKVDSAFGRVMGLPNLSPQQLQTIGALSDDFRGRSDSLTDRSITQTDRSDSTMKDLMVGGPGGAGGATAKKIHAMDSASQLRTDAAYDREELNARALRHLRSTLTPEQAQAAKLN